MNLVILGNFVVLVISANFVNFVISAIFIFCDFLLISTNVEFGDFGNMIFCESYDFGEFYEFTESSDFREFLRF